MNILVEPQWNTACALQMDWVKETVLNVLGDPHSSV